jgi:hypothetical protein
MTVHASLLLQAEATEAVSLGRRIGAGDLWRGGSCTHYIEASLPIEASPGSSQPRNSTAALRFCRTTLQTSCSLFRRAPVRRNRQVSCRHLLSPPHKFSFFFLEVQWGWVHLVRRPRMIDHECGAVGGMRIGRGNRSTRRKPAPVPLCQQQIPHDLTWARTRAVALGSRRLTAWATARPAPPYKLRTRKLKWR